jgi:glycosyltransferase involved in cell wall biosynthesis
MNTLDFSIVIANYNSGTFLEDALLSVIKQQYPKLQLIVIDGGSTDNSVDIIKKYDRYIDYWVSEKDNGQSDAFNKGFAKAKYDWMFWLNADDFLTKNALFNLSSLIQKELVIRPELKWFNFDNLLTDENGFCVQALYGPQYNRFFMKKLGPQVHSATTIFHRKLFEKTRKFDLNLYWSMDLDLWIQFHSLGYQYRNLRTFAYAIRINKQSKTFSQGLKVTRSEERWRQTAYMWNNNNFHVKRSWIFPWRLYKAVTMLPMKILTTIRYRGTNIRWF